MLMNMSLVRNAQSNMAKVNGTVAFFIGTAVTFNGIFASKISCSSPTSVSTP